MGWYERFRVHERMDKLERGHQKLELGQQELKAKTEKLEERWSRLLWQVQAVVRSIIKQYFARRDD